MSEAILTPDVVSSVSRYDGPAVRRVFLTLAGGEVDVGVVGGAAGAVGGLAVEVRRDGRSRRQIPVAESGTGRGRRWRGDADDNVGPQLSERERQCGLRSVPRLTQVRTHRGGTAPAKGPGPARAADSVAASATETCH